MSEKETLINTLLANGLAASRTEAQRMADNMISTSDKVNESMRHAKNTTHNSMVKDYGEQRRATQASQASVAAEVPTAPISGTPKEQKIEELRRSALNPQPINVQTDFDMPSNNQQEETTDFSAEPTSEPSLPSVEPTLEVEHSTENKPSEMTPESYAARQMTDMGANTVSDLTAEPVQNSTVEEVVIPNHLDPTAPAESTSNNLESGFAQDNFGAQEQPVEEAMNESPRDFISQEPELPASSPTTLEPSLPTPEETHEQVPLEAVGAPIASEPQEAPQQPIEQAQEQPVAQETQTSEEPKRKKAEFTEEEKKLAEEVDLSKVFNFSNR